MPAVRRGPFARLKDERGSIPLRITYGEFAAHHYDFINIRAPQPRTIRALQFTVFPSKAVLKIEISHYH